MRFLLSLLVSISIYFIILFFLVIYVYYSKSHNISFTSKKDNSVDVFLIETKDDKKSPVHNDVQIESKKLTTQTATPVSSAKTSVKDIFSKVDANITKTQEKKQLPDNSKKNIDKYLNNNREYSGNQIINQLDDGIKKSTVSSNKMGIYDEFRGKVQEILDYNWQKTVGVNPGLKASVKIFIDKNGSFRYKVLRFSSNAYFNDKLIYFLDEMKKIKFPNYEGSSEFFGTFTFKDEILEYQK